MWRKLIKRSSQGRLLIQPDSSIFIGVAIKTKFFRILFLTSILLNLAAAGYFGKKLLLKFQTASAAPAPPKPAYYLERDKLFEALPKDSNTIVFLGNSLTQYFELAEMLKNPSVRNRGIHGDMSEGVLNRLSPVIASQPQKIFIEIGINDLERKLSNEQLLQNYRQLIDTLKAACPRAKIYVQSLLPVADSSQQLASYCSPEMNKRIVNVNRDLRLLASEKQCAYIDVHPHMLKGRALNPQFSVDGVHLSGEGYIQWANVLKPFVAE